MASVIIAGMDRVPGWEGRLVMVIERYRTAPYALGESDCFRFALAAIEALVGVDYWPQFAGRYRTKQESLRVLAEYGPSLAAAFTALTGLHSSPVRQARRGDIVELVDLLGERHFGVCVGASAAMYAEQGVTSVGLLACERAWRIG